MGTFVQPNLAVVNNNNNNNSINNNNNTNKPTVTVVQTPNGFHEVKVDDDKVDIPMVVDESKLQQQQQQQQQLQQQKRHQSGTNVPGQLSESPNKPLPENCQRVLVENNRRIKIEDGEISSPTSPSFIDINSLPMVFDDTKLFQNVSVFIL